MRKNISIKLPTDNNNLLNSTNSFFDFNKTDTLQIESNNKFYNTSTNFRTNLYKNKFKNISIIGNNDRNNNELNLTTQSFNKRKIFTSKEIKQMTQEQIKNYIIYLKNNISSSFIANNELNSEYNKLLLKLGKINESISKNKQIFNSLRKSIKLNSEKNKQNKNIYINLIEQYKLNNDKGENEYNILNQKINAQEKEIIKFIKENNILNNDLNQKKILIEKLKAFIELMKYKQINNDLKEEKNKIIKKNEKMEKAKMLIEKNEELKLNRNNLKNELSRIDEEYSEIINSKNKLQNKINLMKNNINYEINLNKSSQFLDDNDDLKNEDNFTSEKYFNKDRKYHTINDLASIEYDIENSSISNKKLIEIGKKCKFNRNKLIKNKNNIKEPVKKNNKLIQQKNPNNNNENKIIEDKNKMIKSNEIPKEILIEKNNNIFRELKSIKNGKGKNKLSTKNENNNNKILNIKAIKAQNNNLNNIKLKNNLTETNFNEHNKIDNNKIKSKNSSYDNILINNSPKINKISFQRKGKYIYTINNNGQFLSYSIELKQFIYINISIIKGWKDFYFSYYKNNSEGSLLLNTLGGLFVLTGDNYNKLFYYSQYKNSIYLIKTFKTNHKYGGMLLTKDGNKIIILGGESSNEVILFDMQKNEIINLPNLKHKRINSSYNLINDRYIFAFFGRGNNTIEYLDLNNIKNSWNILNYKSNNIFEELEGHIDFNIKNNVIIIVGGRNNDSILVFYLKEKFLDITDIKINLQEQNDINELFFDREKCFNVIYNDENNCNEIIGMDNKGNVHCFSDDYNYTIFVFL